MGSSRSKIRVFVVEDHPSTARALKVFLSLRRCEVALASSMNSALELAPTIEYDVLVCDLNLPDGSGWELIIRLGPTARNRAVAYTAFDGPEHVHKSRRSRFADHIVKGCDPDELMAAIDRAFKGKGRLLEKARRARKTRRMSDG